MLRSIRSVTSRSTLLTLVTMSVLCCSRMEAPEPRGASAAYNDPRAPKAAAAAEFAAESELADEEAMADWSVPAQAPSPVQPVTRDKRKTLERPTIAIAGKGAQPTPAAPELQTERYAHITEATFTPVSSKPLSTFSIDVDTASYANVRRLLTAGQGVDPGAVRIEEMINYFTYDYPQPTSKTPFSVTTEVSQAPWAPDHSLVLVGLQGRHVDIAELPPRNLVFLVDVSGSMEDANKLPLLKQSFTKLLDTLGHRDRVALVVYAGASGVVLPSTPATERRTIMDALDRLQAGGSTNGAAGIELAYQIAEQQGNSGGINRVILATDGDFNVGTTSESALVELIEAKRKTGVYLTVLGFGMGNYNDSTLERLADHGNGNYAYIDTLAEAQKVLVTESSGTLLTIAKDVKIQVEFNPATVGAYRLIGYENRSLADHEFNDDNKDAGEIGAGHRVTALYELLTPAQAKALRGAEALTYQRSQTTGAQTDLMTVKLRYKPPQSETSELLSVAVANRSVQLKQSSENLRFASSVAAFGMYLRRSEFAGGTNPTSILDLASGALGKDPYGHRAEFLTLVQAARNTQAMVVAK